jgi:hypothetical protein
MKNQSENGTGAIGSGQRIENFREDARGLGAEAFEDRHGGGFMILTAAGFKFDRANTSTEMILLDAHEEAGERTAGVSVLVFPIRARKASHTHLITVGRTSKNDVAIPDVSVSRFHAYFKRGRDGRYQVLDAGSTNGTTVNGLSVPSQSAGSPVDLKTGDSVRLGQTDFTFLKAEALREFVLKFED